MSATTYGWVVDKGTCGAVQAGGQPCQVHAMPCHAGPLQSLHAHQVGFGLPKPGPRLSSSALTRTLCTGALLAAAHLFQEVLCGLQVEGGALLAHGSLQVVIVWVGEGDACGVRAVSSVSVEGQVLLLIGS